MDPDRHKCVYVGNLSWRVDGEKLTNHMCQCGDVKRVDVFADGEGKSKGCGVVEFYNSDDAQRAIKELTDTELHDRLIFVREDREEFTGTYHHRPERHYHHRGGGRGGHHGQYRYFQRPYYHHQPHHHHHHQYQHQHQPYHHQHHNNNHRDGRYPGRFRRSADMGGSMLFVSNLPYRLTWHGLKDLFRDAGDIMRADVHSFHDGKSKGCGTVLFSNEHDAQRAIDMYHEYEVDGRKMGVRFDKM